MQLWSASLNCSEVVRAYDMGLPRCGRLGNDSDADFKAAMVLLNKHTAPVEMVQLAMTSAKHHELSVRGPKENKQKTPSPHEMQAAEGLSVVSSQNIYA